MTGRAYFYFERPNFVGKRKKELPILYKNRLHRRLSTRQYLRPVTHSGTITCKN